MIISASRRTDIPALYSKWFFNRLEAGFVMIPNPRVPNRLGRVELSPDTVDCIVLWTKNPAPMLDKLNRIEAIDDPTLLYTQQISYGELTLRALSVYM